MDTEKMKEFFTTAGVKLLYGIIILIVGLFVVSSIVRFIKKSKVFQKLEPSLQSFLLNTLKLVLNVVVVLSAANEIGVPLTSIITIFASAGVAISLGMQGALGNLVGGVTLLILKPIKVGEFVKIGEHIGFVKTIGAFYTEIKKKDGTLINIPNSSLTNTAIINFSREEDHRVAVSFLVDSSSDIDTVKKVLLDMVKGCDMVLENPKPKIVLDELNPSGMVFEARGWCKAENFSKLRKYMVLNGKIALDKAGIHIPYQQLDVHVKQD